MGFGLITLSVIIASVTLATPGDSTSERSSVASSRLPDVQPGFSVAPSTENQCWVFTHMNKAGGTSVKKMISSFGEENNLPVEVYHEGEYNLGEKEATQFLNRNSSLMVGGYTEGLRHHPKVQDCKWFTMIRHPIPRLVSAFFYCRNGCQDQLCASKILNADDSDLYAFAEHWGNFGLMQFALAFVDQDQLLGAEAPSGPCATRCPSWYKAKLYFEGLLEPDEIKDPGTNQTEESRMARLFDILEPIEGLLRTKYAAVGVLEDWERSMALFDRALLIPDFSWADASIKAKQRKKNDKQEKKDVLAAAWTDQALTKYIAFDLLVYEFAFGVHRKQLAEYGI